MAGTPASDHACGTTGVDGWPRPSTCSASSPQTRRARCATSSLTAKGGPQFLDFCKQLRRRFPVGTLYLFCDSHEPHAKAEVANWCATHGIALVYTPSNASWHRQQDRPASGLPPAGPGHRDRDQRRNPSRQQGSSRRRHRRRGHPARTGAEQNRAGRRGRSRARRRRRHRGHRTPDPRGRLALRVQGPLTVQVGALVPGHR